MLQNESVTILLVDDKTANIFALQQMLARPGREFLTATNGKEALKIMLNQVVDLIILDVQMPEMDGFEVAQILNSNRRTKEIPIIFATAEKKEHQSMMKGFEEGAVDYLFKPLDKEVTEAKVSVLLKLHLQKKELVEKNLVLEKHSLLINNSADIICIINPSTFKFEEINQAVAAILGYSPSDILGTPLLFYLPDNHRAVVKKLAKSSKQSFSFETPVYAINRTIRWLHWNIVSRHGLWFANARDITESKEVEEIKNYLAAVVKQSAEAIYLHHPDGGIISWNKGAEAIYGYSEDEALRMKIWNIVPDHLLAEAQGVVESVLKQEQITALETKRITKYGKIIDVVFSASVILDSDNQLKSVAITERDITRQKEIEREIRDLNVELQRNNEQLLMINRELESFSYSVSHDLRAPLRSINSYASILEEDHGDSLSEEARRLFKIIGKNARKMGTLIDDLLAFSRLGRTEIEKRNFRVKELVEHVVTELHLHDQDKVKVKLKNLPPASGDHKLVHQVFVNLISNAVKYSSKKKNPSIEIGCDTGQTWPVYYVKDNGAGFDMAYSHRLFGVFQRLHKDEEFEGTGVGLAIVHKIVTKHGGTVWAESEVEKGSTFFFTLPPAVENSPGD